MSAVETLRRQAEKLAGQLVDAEAKAATAHQDRADRNQARVVAFWSDATERCAVAREGVTTARARVQAHLVAGEGAQALDGFLAYLQHHAELVNVNGAAAAATASYADEAGRDLGTVRAYHQTHDGPPMGNYHLKHAPGVTTRVDQPASWDTLLAEGVKALTAAHSAAHAVAYVVDLTRDLEPEGDQ